MALGAALRVAGGASPACGYSAAAGLRDGRDRWTQDRRIAGWNIELGDPEVTGFPMRLEVFVQTPRISGPGSRWRWDAPNIRARAAPWSPRKIFVSAPGLHVVTLTAGDVWAELGRAEADIVVGQRGFRNLIGRFSGVVPRFPGGQNLVADSAVIRLLESVAPRPSF